MSHELPVTWCDDPTTWRPSRRLFLQVGISGVLGLTLDGFLRLRSAQAGADTKKPEPRAQSLIHIFLPGGLAAQESFDPKPYAPIEYRGELGTVKTRLDGVLFSDLLPRTAQIADRLVVVRGMSHGEAAHERGTHNMFTGYRPSAAIVYPSLGSVVAHELGPRNNLPPYVCIPAQPNIYAGPGYLSPSYSPFSLGGDPANPQFAVKDLARPAGVDDQRFAVRKSLLEQVNAHFAARERSGELEAMDSFYQRAYELMSSQKAREAFDLGAEPPALRDAYGRNAAGQRLLMARRLVEAGVRFVSLTYGGWDMHDQITPAMRQQMPPFDQAFAALIGDLEQRGMLERTLVMVTTEFGRTPKINRTGGRDHWPKVFSIVLAGGGTKRGLVYGASNATATEPEEDELNVADWAATVYSLLGIDPAKKLLAPGNRPIDLVREGHVRKELLA